jgi:hypothetical protein
MACDLCGGDAYLVVATRARFGACATNVVCRGCGFVYIEPRPTDEAVERFYCEQYVRSSLYYEPGVVAAESERAGQSAARERGAFVERHVARPGLRLLDVGAGPGSFAVSMRRKGWQVATVEPVPELREHLRASHNLEAYARLEDVPNGQWAVITMFHVLEHVPSPRTTAVLVRQLLECTGIWVVEVPNLLTPNWAHPDEFFQVAHLSTFSPNSLRRLLLSAGFRVEVLEPAGYFLRAVAMPAADRAVTGGSLPTDDAFAIERLIARRRRWYWVMGFWRDQAWRVALNGRRAAKRAILAVAGEGRGREIIARFRGLRRSTQ